MKVDCQQDIFRLCLKAIEKRKSTTCGGCGLLNMLTSCQPSTPSVQTTAERAPCRIVPSPTQSGRCADIVGDLIDQVEEEQITQIEEVALVATGLLSLCLLTMSAAALLKRH